MTTDRHDAVRKLADEYWIAYEGPCSDTGEEDIRELLEESELLPWAAVTRHGDVHYLYNEETQEQAQTRAGCNVGDGIHEELPVCVVNLDTGERHCAELRIGWVKS